MESRDGRARCYPKGVQPSRRWLLSRYSCGLFRARFAVALRGRTVGATPNLLNERSTVAKATTWTYKLRRTQMWIMLICGRNALSLAQVTLCRLGPSRQSALCRHNKPTDTRFTHGFVRCVTWPRYSPSPSIFTQNGACVDVR